MQRPLRVTFEVEYLGLISDLEKINWDFSNAWSTYGVHDFHWFPARLIPQIPGILITTLTKRADVVLDPFCGSGSTLVEALRLGRKPIGVDVVPLACLISRVKTFIIEPKLLEETACRFLRETKRMRKNLKLTKTVLLPEIIPADKLEKYHQDSRILPIERWFHPQTFYEIELIKELIDLQETAEFKNFFTVCLSDRLKSCCSQNRHGHHWGYISDNVLPKFLTYVNALDQFENHLKKMVNGMKELYEECKKLGVSIETINKYSKVRIHDARRLREIIEPESIDFALTSPPYPHAIDYTKSGRLSLLMLGLDITAIQNVEIGARWKRGRQHGIDQYVKEMATSLGQIYDVLKQGSYLVLIFGQLENEQKRVAIDNLLEIAESAIGFSEKKKLSRKITHQIIGARSVPRETIYVLEK